MQKKLYLTPETTEMSVREETILCVSGMDASHEGFTAGDEDYNMFNQF